MDINNATDKEWDIIVVGGGMGGGIIANALTQKGFEVLLLEKGLGGFDETEHQSVSEEEPDPEIRIKNGKWPNKIKGKVDGADIEIWPPLGCGVGGSTLLYAAALQRFDYRDFKNRILTTGEEVSWPFTYEELLPYYEKAERLFSVCGTHDPLSLEEKPSLGNPPPMCEADQLLFHCFKKNGLHPYRLHVGINYRDDCSECGGHICKYSCKQSAYNCGIIPAQATGRLKIIERAEVIKLQADNSIIKSVQLRRLGTEFEIRAKIVVLSAGSMFSPIILLRSKNEFWPEGLANNNGLVGRNLMFHCTDFISVWPPKKSSNRGANKTIALRDFYFYEGKKLGEFQSTGLSAGYGNVLYALRLMYDQSFFRKIPFLRHFLRIPAYLACKLFGRATIFTTIVEDNPYPENKVFLDESVPSGIRFEYTIHEELKQRNYLLRKLMRKRMNGLKSIPLFLGVSLNYGHPSGTCRAGNDPATSVLDKTCRTHGLKNLYVVDGSFMPTSGGTNPSLTIAANALRVADVIENRFGGTR